MAYNKPKGIYETSHCVCLHRGYTTPEEIGLSAVRHGTATAHAMFWMTYDHRTLDLPPRFELSNKLWKRLQKPLSTNLNEGI